MEVGAPGAGPGRRGSGGDQWLLDDEHAVGVMPYRAVEQEPQSPKESSKDERIEEEGDDAHCDNHLYERADEAHGSTHQFSPGTGELREYMTIYKLFCQYRGNHAADRVKKLLDEDLQKAADLIG